MYANKTFVNLPTNAAPVNNNIALCHGKDLELLASSIAVQQEAYVSIVPLVRTERRSKYIPLSHENRGEGIVKEVRWLEVASKTYFLVLSTRGLQVYDEDGSQLIFEHPCKDTGDDRSYCVGVCVLHDNILCVGTWLGTVWLFRLDSATGDFKYVNRVYAHDEAVLLLSGEGKRMASTSTDMTYLWTFTGREFRIVRKLAVQGLVSTPSTLLYKYGFVFLGFRSGEFCIFDWNINDFEVRVAAHKLQVTSLDISAAFLIVTSSDDCHVKIWRFRQQSGSVEMLQTIFNEDGPVYGVGFLNEAGTEFAAVTGDSAKVHLYVTWEEAATQ